MHKPRCFAVGILLAALNCGCAFGAIRTWNGGGADDNWTTADNWGGTVPLAGDDLVFDGTTRLTPNNDFPADTNFRSITFNAGDFTVGGNSVVIGGIGVAFNNPTIVNNAGSNALNLTITFKSAANLLTITAATGSSLIV